MPAGRAPKGERGWLWHAGLARQYGHYGYRKIAEQASPFVTLVPMFQSNFLPRATLVSEGEASCVKRHLKGPTPPDCRGRFNTGRLRVTNKARVIWRWLHFGEILPYALAGVLLR